MIEINEIYNYEDLNEKEVILNLLRSKEETHGTHLISFFFKKLKFDHTSKLRKQISEAKNIKSKETQKIVTEGVNTLLEVVSALLSKKYDFSGPGVIFVKGSFYAVLKLPSHYNTELYFCGKSFRTDLLSETVEKAWGLIVLDTREVSIGVFSNNIVTVLSNFDAFVPHKMKAGGQSAARFEETRKNKVLELIEKVSNIANTAFSKYDVDKILLGGVIPTNTNFYVNNCLLPQYKEILQEPTSTCYTSIEGLEELIEKNKELYNEELEQYYEEKNQKQYIIKNLNELVYSSEMINNVEISRPVKIWALAGYSNLGYYCDVCNLIYYRQDDCEHQKVDLKRQEEISKYYFDPKSRAGAVLSHQGKIFYETTIKQS